MIEIDSRTGQKRLIEASFGILPVSAIEEELRLGTLVVLPVPWLAATVPVVAIHRRDGGLSRTARHMVTALRDIEGEPSLTEQG